MKEEFQADTKSLVTLKKGNVLSKEANAHSGSELKRIPAASIEAQIERDLLLTNAKDYVLQIKETADLIKVQSEQLTSQKTEIETLRSELKSKSAFLETVFEQMPAGVYITDANDGKIIFANKRIGEIIGQPLFQMNDIQDLLTLPAWRSDGRAFDKNERPVVRTLKTGETITDEELRFHRPDGKAAVILVNSAPVRDSEGNIIAAVVIMQDVTDKKRVEADLRKHKRNLETLVSERTVELKMANERLAQESATRTQMHEALVEQSAILEAFFRHVSIPIVLLNRHFDFVRVNEEYAKACNRKISSFAGHNYFEFYPDNENLSIFENVVATKTPFQTVAKPFVFPDHPEWGTTYWDWSLVPIADKNGEVELLILSLNDVTPHKRAQDEIARLSQFRETVINAADVWMFVTDEEGRIIIWNHAAEKISGYDREDIVGGKNSWQLLYPDESYCKKVVELFLSVLKEGEVIEDFESTIKTKAGHRKTISWNARPLAGPDEKHIGLMAVGKDITEQKELDAKMHRYQQQLRSMASQMSLTEERLRRRIATELHDGIGQLLAISKIKLGQFRHNAGKVGLSEPLDEIHHLVEDAIGYTRSLTVELSPPVLYELGLEAALEWLCEHIQKQHKLQCSVKSRLPEQLDGDLSILLFQVVRELMHNIVKHAQACSVLISADIIADKILVHVVDDGVGFNVEEVSARPDHAGGFGLFNVQERLNHLGGRLEVNSKLGRGTRVTVIAPVKTS